MSELLVTHLLENECTIKESGADFGGVLGVGVDLIVLPIRVGE